MKKQIVTILTLLALIIMESSCAVVMATKQPNKKNLDILVPGTPRVLIIAEFGAPISTETKDGKKQDIFSFVQGYSKGAKVGRAFVHGVADVMTLGLWEVVGTPTEAIFDGENLVLQVCYDTNEKLESCTTLKKK